MRALCGAAFRAAYRAAAVAVALGAAVLPARADDDSAAAKLRRLEERQQAAEQQIEQLRARVARLDGGAAKSDVESLRAALEQLAAERREDRRALDELKARAAAETAGAPTPGAAAETAAAANGAPTPGAATEGANAPAAPARTIGEPSRETPPSATGPRGPADPVGLAPYDVADATGAVSSGSSFNPSISVIPSGLYYHDGREGDGDALLARADGFGLGPEARKSGFNLGETEVAISGAVDPYFDAWAVLSFDGDGGASVEEAYAQTRALPWGLQLRFGKFKSGVGYLNKQHSHQWDFVDAPLPYQLLFGEALADTGLQMNWVPRLPFYATIGVEALQGENEFVAAYVGRDDEHPYFDRKSGPRLFTAFAKIAPDVGYSSALQLGASYGRATRHQEIVQFLGADEARQGTTRFFGLDAVYKYDSGRQYGAGGLSLVAEYIRRVKDLDVVGLADDRLGDRRRATQDGYFAQAVYGVAPRLTIGLRRDVAGATNRLDAGSLGTIDYDAVSRWSADVTANLTEFSRLRVQWSRTRVPIDGSGETFGQLFVQYQLSLGAHGAHKF
ncbi:porin [bacterium]|nr:porin [bacterium]